eukprot:SAG11_NODE_6768_length_1251_cov_13.323785_2_plen_168_part_01
MPFGLPVINSDSNATAGRYELGQENYVPQTYFYARDGRHLSIVVPFGDEYAHSFMTEAALVDGMRNALERDQRLAAGEAYTSVLGLPSPPPPSPPPPPANEFGCMEGWAGDECDRCAAGYENCDVRSPPEHGGGGGGGGSGQFPRGVGPKIRFVGGCMKRVEKILTGI